MGNKVEIKSGNLAEKVHDLDVIQGELIPQLCKSSPLRGKREACG